MSGADIGGFATSSAGDQQNGTPIPCNVYDGKVYDGITDPELLTRWTEVSAFIGWCRNHYDGYNKQYQEPFAYADPYRSACRKYIEIRYKLLQLFYDLLYQCTQTGLPICRPLFITDRIDLSVYEPQWLNTQFLVGNDLLIAPITKRGSRYRDVYLPAGSDWYAYQDARAPLIGPNKGGTAINWYAPVDIVPMNVRAGAILPRRLLEQYVGELPECPLTFECYPGPDRTYSLFLDDKIGFGYQKDKVRLTTIAHQTILGERLVRKVTVARTWDQYTPKEAYFFIALLQVVRPSSVTLHDSKVADLTTTHDEASAAALAASSDNGFYFSTSLHTVFIKIFDNAPLLEVITTF